ncbi:MAG TPA: hypothetical protein DCX82_06785 [Lachnospiraceae bacterium]|jgi:rubrerythrin|nr:hypothetical protein [Lachnospiraceae bacterium]
MDTVRNAEQIAYKTNYYIEGNKKDKGEHGYELGGKKDIYKKNTVCDSCINGLCVLFLSNIFISEHIRHNCTGERCPICAEIHHAQNLIN